MDFLQVIFAAADLGVSVIFSVTEKIGDHLRDARSSMRDEIYLAYKEFSNTVSAGTIDNTSIERMKRLHYSYGEDGVKIVFLDWAIKKAGKILHLMTFLVIVSLVIGNVLDFKESSLYKSMLTIYIPIVALLVQVFIVAMATQAAQFLKNMRTRYIRREY